VVVRRLRLLSALSDAELELLRSLGDRRHRHAAGEELVTEGDPTDRPRFIVSGWACRQRVLPDGRRQIFNFLLPGDGLGLNRSLGAELSTVTAPSRPAKRRDWPGRSPPSSRSNTSCCSTIWSGWAGRRPTSGSRISCWSCNAAWRSSASATTSGSRCRSPRRSWPTRSA
jgi:CRP-like cAMP-binding protein